MQGILLFSFLLHSAIGQPTSREDPCCETDGGPVLEEDTKANLEVLQFVSSDQIVPGSPVIIEGVIKRNKVDSFLKIDFKIPGSPAWETQGMQSDGGTYSRSGDVVSYRWLRIPLEKTEFRVKFRITPPASFTGRFSVAGSYYYIQDEKKIEYPIVPKEIFVANKIKNDGL